MEYEDFTDCELVGHMYSESKYIGTTYNHDGNPIEVFEQFCFVCGHRNELKDYEGRYGSDG